MALRAIDRQCTFLPCAFNSKPFYRQGDALAAADAQRDDTGFCRNKRVLGKLTTDFNDKV
jgi:hypothetical protein